MITQRPDHLTSDAAYKTLPRAPLHIDWESVPELVRVVMLDLSGIQPPTSAMVEAAGGDLQDKPSEGEIALFQSRGTEFQLISVVLSLVPGNVVDGVLQFKPFAVTLIPASKRNAVQTASVELVAKLDIAEWLRSEPMYTGYDPFSGDWTLFGNMPGYLDGERQAFLDGVGIVVDQFFLATETGDDEILMIDMKMSSEEAAEKYKKHRKKLFFKPFSKVESRRIWGAETAIELFLIQALAKEKLFPQSQMLIMNDGTVFPSLFHLWRDPQFRHSADVITSVDLYFPDERIAVFCDGSNHSRKKNRDRDRAIDAKLVALKIQPVRILGSEIKFDLGNIVTRLKEILKAQSEGGGEGMKEITLAV